MGSIRLKKYLLDIIKTKFRSRLIIKVYFAKNIYYYEICRTTELKMGIGDP